jgi:hypothetical protein
VGEHRALARARGAAGVLQQREVGRGVQRHLPGGQARSLEQVQEALDRRALGQLGGDLGPGPLGLLDRQAQLELGHRRQVVRDARDDDVLHRRPLAHPRHRLVDAVQADHDGGAAVGELVAELGLGVERVVLDDHRAQPQRGEGGDDVLGAVGQHDRHPVALADPEAGQGGGEGVDGALQLAVGGAGAEEGQRGAAGPGGGGVVQQPGERDVGDLDLGRHARRVVRQPRPGVVRRGARPARARAGCGLPGTRCRGAGHGGAPDEDGG